MRAPGCHQIPDRLVYVHGGEPGLRREPAGERVLQLLTRDAAR